MCAIISGDEDDLDTLAAAFRAEGSSDQDDQAGLANLFLTGEATGNNSQGVIATNDSNQRGRRQIVGEENVSNPPKKKSKTDQY